MYVPDAMGHALSAETVELKKAVLRLSLTPKKHTSEDGQDSLAAF
jgi:hypothetical protein